MVVHELSIGDYVLAGGESAVLVMAEAICRLKPGVLGNALSAADDSFGAGEGPMSGLVEGPAYTRPRSWRGLEVPEVLLSGDHAAIARWRRDQSLRRTARNRPDLAARVAAATSRRSGSAESFPRLVSQSVVKMWHTESRCPQQRPIISAGSRRTPSLRPDHFSAFADVRVMTMRTTSDALRDSRA